MLCNVMHRTILLLAHCIIAAWVVTALSCNTHNATQLPRLTLSARLPADCNAAVDTFITQGKYRLLPDSAIQTFNILAAKYRSRDTLAFAAMRAYSAQAWDAKAAGDSVIAACEDALDYFDNHLSELDMRTMCHLYSGWGYYYKKNQLTANYFFSLAGNDLTDSIYLAERGEYVTSAYPLATKAALLTEIASMARISGLDDQAQHYIALAEQQIARMAPPDTFLAAAVCIEAGTIYTRLQQYDSARFMFRLAAANPTLKADTSILQLYRERLVLFYVATSRYDSAISGSLQYQATAIADTIATKSSEATQQLITLAQAYTASGNYGKGSKILAAIGSRLMPDSAILADLRILYLEAKTSNIIAGHEGAKGYKLLQDYTNAKDQLYDQQRLATITDMDARYKMRRREEAISRLNTDNEAYARKLRRQTKLLIIAVLSVLLLVALVIIINQRQARRRLQVSVDKMELEQRLLRSQMEPHFIFNTLAVLQGLIRREEKDRSIKYLNQFARLLRISLEHARESLVPLRGEVEAMGHYLSLQELRFQHAFTYTITTWDHYDEESEDLLIPPMLLQPFAENALEHGMKGLEGRTGNIQINLKKEGITILCTVKDNGIGYDMNAPLQSGEKQSLATIITRERLAILAKKSRQAASLNIVSAPGSGTTVTLRIPYLISGQKHY